MFCRKCGSKLDDESLFCSKCGTPVLTDLSNNDSNNSTAFQKNEVLSNNVAHEEKQQQEYKPQRAASSGITKNPRKIKRETSEILMAFVISFIPLLLILIVAFLATDTGKSLTDGIKALPAYSYSLFHNKSKQSSSTNYELLAKTVVTPRVYELYGTTAQYISGVKVSVNRTYKTSNGKKN